MEKSNDIKEMKFIKLPYYDIIPVSNIIKIKKFLRRDYFGEVHKYAVETNIFDLDGKRLIYEVNKSVYDYLDNLTS